MRFIDNKDGTITDNQTRLIWFKDAKIGKMNWNKAIDICKELGEGWRLPKIEELISLIDYSQYKPALPANHPFENVQSFGYWSITTYAFCTNHVWLVYMFDGQVGDFDKTNNYYVWPVQTSKK